jgi:CRP/FNR family transcriptional regulator
VVRDVHWGRVTCPTCRSRDVCITEGLDPEGVRELTHSRATPSGCGKGNPVPDGRSLHGALRHSLGLVQDRVLSENGSDQVSGYHMVGEIIGTDGIGDDTHSCQAVALEDTEVCALPFKRMER